MSRLLDGMVECELRGDALSVGSYTRRESTGRGRRQWILDRLSFAIYPML